MPFYREFPKHTRTENSNSQTTNSTAEIHAAPLSHEQVTIAMQELHDRLHSYRIQHQNDMIGSQKDAEQFVSHLK